MEPLPTDQQQTLPDHNQTLMQRMLQEWKQLALLGAPIFIAQLAQMANGVIDTVMAGHASAEDLAGVGIGTSMWVPVLLFFVGVLGALQPTISGHRGAGEFHKIMPAVWQGIYIAIAGMVLMVLLLVNLDPLLTLLKLDAATTAIADGYLSAFAWGVPALLLLTALRGLTDGLGHTRVIMVFSLISTLLNLPLNYAFIYGFDFGFFLLPAMGGIGCGWATSISNWVATLALLVYLNRSSIYKNFHLISNWASPKWNEINRLLKLGLPIGFTLFIEVSMFCMIALFLAPLGATTVAGHQIVLNAISLLFMLPMSLGMAITLRVSFLVGAQDTDEARLLARSSLLLALGIACINAPILFFGRDWLASLYTSDPEVQKVAAQLFMFGAIFQIADVIQVTMINVQRGYKDTKIPMFIMLISFWGISLPLGYALTFKEWITDPIGAPGFWMGLTVGLICAAILLTTRMLRFKPAASDHSSFVDAH
ncbi:MATE family efflux transporter [Cellvibrio sp. pealriver]|uniref:MATE family efflux transporter n=1 Tax=Cellvibrio sp. pealriver TaxID=1622269 RepID=UPI000AB8279A|nr:MATE family efflux transporter [Cellvibrio sp. pealriver]